MAVLDHQGAKPINGYLAVCNVSLVFVGILLLAYVFSVVF
jgi:hypothetical protein